MGRGRGSKIGKGGARAGLLGLRGFAPSTGPNPGRGMGRGSPGTEEDTKFEGKRLHPNELNPGQMVGTLPAGEDAPKGEARIPVWEMSTEALQRMAEKVDNEVLPAEYRDQIRRYMELLRQPAAGSRTGDE